MYAINIKIENGREVDSPRERDGRIELSDKELAEKMRAAGLVYRPPNLEDKSPEFKRKLKKAKEITKETQIIDLRGVEKNEQNKSKSPKRKAKKVSPKLYTPAVAKVQKKLS